MNWSCEDGEVVSVHSSVKGGLVKVVPALFDEFFDWCDLFCLVRNARKKAKNDSLFSLRGSEPSTLKVEEMIGIDGAARCAVACLDFISFDFHAGNCFCLCSLVNDEGMVAKMGHGLLCRRKDVDIGVGCYVRTVLYNGFDGQV